MSSAVTNWTSISAARSSLCQDPSVSFHLFVMSAISTTPFDLCKGKDTVKTFFGSEYVSRSLPPVRVCIVFTYTSPSF